MSDLTLVMVSVLAGVAVGLPFLLAFRARGRSRCWRCRVWMLPVRVRVRPFGWLPIGHCEGCNILCLALGPRVGKKD